MIISPMVQVTFILKDTHILFCLLSDDHHLSNMVLGLNLPNFTF
jgi:hypothetical protein